MKRHGRHHQGSGAGTEDRQGRFERMLLSVMGPPQLGDVNAPAARRLDPQVDLCTRCGKPWDDHTHVRSGSYSYLTCPGDEG